jgi:hypothetical protein
VPVFDYLPITLVDEPMYLMPVLAGANGVGEFEQRGFALKAHDAIKFRDQFQSLFITKAGKVALPS